MKSFPAPQPWRSSQLILGTSLQQVAQLVFCPVDIQTGLHVEVCSASQTGSVLPSFHAALLRSWQLDGSLSHPTSPRRWGSLSTSPFLYLWISRNMETHMTPGVDLLCVCHPGQVTWPLWASLHSSINLGGNFGGGLYEISQTTNEYIAWHIMSLSKHSYTHTCPFCLLCHQPLCHILCGQHWVLLGHCSPGFPAPMQAAHGGKLLRGPKKPPLGFWSALGL